MNLLEYSGICIFFNIKPSKPELEFIKKINSNNCPTLVVLRMHVSVKWRRLFLI
jgi:hypothetical protein